VHNWLAPNSSTARGGDAVHASQLHLLNLLSTDVCPHLTCRKAMQILTAAYIGQVIFLAHTQRIPHLPCS
jgi:hypothetical protein